MLKLKRIIKMKIKYLILLGLISGCASYSNYQPVVDVSNNANNVNLQKDMVECRQLAEQASNNPDATRNIIGSTILGAGLGSLAGLAFSAPAQGAIIGGVGSVGISGAREAINSDNQFKQAYINCLRSRGHNVIN